jgi:hypothetical protein
MAENDEDVATFTADKPAFASALNHFTVLEFSLSSACALWFARPQSSPPTQNRWTICPAVSVVPLGLRPCGKHVVMPGTSPGQLRHGAFGDSPVGNPP